jgi:hypothetical protein
MKKLIYLFVLIGICVLGKYSTGWALICGALFMMYFIIYAVLSEPTPGPTEYMDSYKNHGSE